MNWPVFLTISSRGPSWILLGVEMGPLGRTKSRCVYGASIFSCPTGLRKSAGTITPPWPSKHIMRIGPFSRCHRWIIERGIHT